MSWVRNFIRVRWSEKLLFCEALLLHLFVGLLLKVVPFRMIPRLFSGRQFETPSETEDQSRRSVSGRQSEIVEKIRMAAQRAGAVSPWRNRCLVSSLSGRWMLNRRKISSEISLGVTKQPDGKTIAHAWLIAAGYELVEKKGSYTEIYKF